MPLPPLCTLCASPGGGFGGVTGGPEQRHPNVGPFASALAHPHLGFRGPLVLGGFAARCGSHLALQGTADVAAPGKEQRSTESPRRGLCPGFSRGAIRKRCLRLSGALAWIKGVCLVSGPDSSPALLVQSWQGERPVGQREMPLVSCLNCFPVTKGVAKTSPLSLLPPAPPGWGEVAQS